MTNQNLTVARRDALKLSASAVPLTVGLTTPLMASNSALAATKKPKNLFVPLIIDSDKILYNKKLVIPADTTEVFFVLRQPGWQFRYLPALIDLEPTPFVELSNVTGGGITIPAPASDLDRWWFSTTLIPKPGAYLNFQFRVFRDQYAPLAAATDPKSKDFIILEEGSIGGGGCIVCE